MMATVMVNARVPSADKLAADRVLRADRRTWSQAVQALASYMARTHSFPEVLEPTDTTSIQQSRREILMSVCGIAKSPSLASDESVAELLHDELVHRYG